MSLSTDSINPKDCLVQNLMVHGSMSDVALAFRNIFDFSRKNSEKDINLIFDNFYLPFMKYWRWESNVKLMPLLADHLDSMNSSFPFECDDLDIVEAFEKNGTNAHDLTGLPPTEDSLNQNLDNVTELSHALLLGFSPYVVIQPISSHYADSYGEEEKNEYNKFLYELTEKILQHTRYNVVFVGLESDKSFMGSIQSKGSESRFYNMIGLLPIEDSLNIVEHSKVVIGQDSFATNIGKYIFNKPVISWNVSKKDRSRFNSRGFSCSPTSLTDYKQKPWEKDFKYYVNFLKDCEKQQNIIS